MDQKLKILIVDDSELNREILTDILESQYDIIEAENGKMAVEILEKRLSEIVIVMLDLVMPEMDGIQVLTMMNEKGWINDVPVVMISSESSPSAMDKAYDLGITDYITRPFDTKTVQRRVMNTIALYSKQKKLVKIVAQQIYEREKTNSMMINILSHIVEFRNGESGLHVIHIKTATSLLLSALSEKYPELNLDRDRINLISMASALHDIGKIVIPEHILNKPGRFTPEEFEIMKKHSAAGADILKEFNSNGNPLIEVAYEICRWHHERFDGRGYPDGLKGSEIPISAQVVAIADVYDALTSERCYKAAIPHEEALQMIADGKCGTFDPLMIDCLMSVAERLKETLSQNTISDTTWSSVQDMTELILKNNDITTSIPITR